MLSNSNLLNGSSLTKGVGYGRFCENPERSYDNGSYYCYVQYDLCSPARRSQPDFAGLVLSYPNFRIIPHWIVLNVNHILLPIGFLLSIPLVLASNNWFMVFLADFIGALPKAYIAPQSLVYSALLTSLSYFGSLLFLRRKVSKINMVESLKGNRE